MRRVVRFGPQKRVRPDTPPPLSSLLSSSCHSERSQGGVGGTCRLSQSTRFSFFHIQPFDTVTLGAPWAAFAVFGWGAVHSRQSRSAQFWQSHSPGPFSRFFLCGDGHPGHTGATNTALLLYSAGCSHACSAVLSIYGIDGARVSTGSPRQSSIQQRLRGSSRWGAPHNDARELHHQRESSYANLTHVPGVPVDRQ